MRLDEKKIKDGPRFASAKMRRCAVSREERPKAELIRFVISPDGEVVADLLGKLSGRGIWLLPERKTLEQAIHRNAFARAAKTSAIIPEGLVKKVENGLLNRVLAQISLARKAGCAITGYEKSKAWVQDGRAEVILQARDASERGKGKLSSRDVPHYIGCLSANELGQAFGRDMAVHAVLSSGALSARVVEEAARLRGFRCESSGKKAQAGQRRHKKLAGKGKTIDE